MQRLTCIPSSVAINIRLHFYWRQIYPIKNGSVYNAHCWLASVKRACLVFCRDGGLLSLRILKLKWNPKYQNSIGPPSSRRKKKQIQHPNQTLDLKMQSRRPPRTHRSPQSCSPRWETYMGFLAPLQAFSNKRKGLPHSQQDWFHPIGNYWLVSPLWLTAWLSRLWHHEGSPCSSYLFSRFPCWFKKISFCTLLQHIPFTAAQNGHVCKFILCAPT